MGNNTHRLTVTAQLENVEEACEFVSDFARSVGMGDDAVYHCYLSVEEICTNIIEHGYQYNGADQVIDVVCASQDHLLMITVIDDATQFDPLQLHDPDPKAPLIERKGGGWGVFFVKKYMDKVMYRYESERNHFIMHKAF